jgi:putative ABC transport system permease protein
MDRLRNVRMCLRVWRRNLKSTLVLIFTLAVGVGALCTVFSALHAILLSDLPYPNAEQLVALNVTVPPDDFLARFIGTNRLNFSYPGFEDVRDQNHSFTEVAAHDINEANCVIGSEAQRLDVCTVTPRYFPLLGIPPLLGRGLIPEDFTPSGSRVVVLGYDLWQARFGGRSDALGRNLLIEGEPLTVVGVMPAHFGGLNTRNWAVRSSLIQTHRRPQLWFPMPPDLKRGRLHIDTVARLRPGTSLEAARSDVKLIAARLQKEFPGQKDQGIEVTTLHEDQRGQYRGFLLILFAAAGIVLFVAVLNSGNLLLEQALHRRTEMAVRTALGGGRRHILGQLFLEGLMLSGIASLLGISFAFIGCRLLNHALAGIFIGLPPIAVDRVVLAFACLVAGLIGIGFGLTPLLFAGQSGPQPLLRQSEVGSGKAKAGWGRLIVAGQVACALVLVICTALLLKTFVYLWQTDPGCRAEQVLTMRVTLSSKEYPEPEQQADFWRRVLERVERLPGVQSAGIVSVLPTTGSHSNTSIRPEGTTSPGQEQVLVHVQGASSRYFATMGIPLTQGRYFEDGDDSAAPLVTVIDQTMARTFWPGQDPIGRSVNLSGQCLRVVGVVGDVRQDGLDKENRSGMYVHYLQDRDWSTEMSLAIRTELAPLSLAATVRRAVHEVDSAQAVSEIRTMETLLSEGLRTPRLLLLLLASLAAITLLLALLGIYGLLSCAVARSQREIGLRMALGARPADVRKMVVHHGLLWILGGEAAGVVLALGVTRLLASRLYGVAPTDPLTFVAVSLALLATGVAACSLPARKATRVDPWVALRSQ